MKEKFWDEQHWSQNRVTVSFKTLKVDGGAGRKVKKKKKWCVSVEWVVPGLKGRPGCFWLVLHLRRTTFLTNEHFNFLGKNKTRNKLPHDKYSTCSFIEFGAVPIIDIFLSDIKLWQSDGVHLHRVSRLPHKLQVVCGVANWRKETVRHCYTQIHTNTDETTLLRP